MRCDSAEFQRLSTPMSCGMSIAPLRADRWPDQQRSEPMGIEMLTRGGNNEVGYRNVKCNFFSMYGRLLVVDVWLTCVSIKMSRTKGSLDAV